MSTGYGRSSSSTAAGIPLSWAGPRWRHFCPGWPTSARGGIDASAGFVGAVGPVSEGAGPEFAVDGGYRPGPARTAFAGGVISR